MDALEALTTRASAVRLSEPAPSDADVADAFRAAARAPDHGLLRPWKFITVRGDARHALGEVMAQALAAREPHVPDSVLTRERQKPFRAPLLIVVAAKVQPDHPKIPEIEQVMSAATAAHNLGIVFHAKGFGTMWRTGAMAYDAAVKRALGLDPHDHIVAIQYVGTPEAHSPDDWRVDPADFVADWTGVPPD